MVTISVVVVVVVGGGYDIIIIIWEMTHPHCRNAHVPQPTIKTFYLFFFCLCTLKKNNKAVVDWGKKKINTAKQDELINKAYNNNNLKIKIILPPSLVIKNIFYAWIQSNIQFFFLDWWECPIIKSEIEYKKERFWGDSSCFLIIHTSANMFCHRHHHQQ